MKKINSSTIGEKISKYLIVKPIIYSKYKLGLGSKELPLNELINQQKNFINLL